MFAKVSAFAAFASVASAVALEATPVMSSMVAPATAAPADNGAVFGDLSFLDDMSSFEDAAAKRALYVAEQERLHDVRVTKANEHFAAKHNLAVARKAAADFDAALKKREAELAAAKAAHEAAVNVHAAAKADKKTKAGLLAAAKADHANAEAELKEATAEREHLDGLISKTKDVLAHLEKGLS